MDHVGEALPSLLVAGDDHVASGPAPRRAHALHPVARILATGGVRLGPGMGRDRLLRGQGFLGEDEVGDTPGAGLLLHADFPNRRHRLRERLGVGQQEPLVVALTAAADRHAAPGRVQGYAELVRRAGARVRPEVLGPRGRGPGYQMHGVGGAPAVAETEADDGGE